MSAALLGRRSPEGETGDFVRRHAELIERSASKMKGLIDDLLDLATLEPGQVALTAEAQEPWRIVTDVADVLRPLAVDKGVEIRSGIPKYLPKVSVDRKRAYQVLSNVLGNAVKYTPGRGSITLSAWPDGEFVRFEIADTGPGIPDEQQALIFERYWTRGSSGTGLGLYIARRLTEAQGGRIQVESTVGVGTVFTIWFPIDRPDASRPATNV
jgi:two-component system, chemotaxis family, sensor kinase Cph1